MAKLICKDGTEIQISDEAEDSLRKTFGSKPEHYEDANITVNVNIDNSNWPINISTDDGGDEEVSRDVESVEALIVALQEAVTYCKQHNLGA